MTVVSYFAGFCPLKNYHCQYFQGKELGQCKARPLIREQGEWPLRHKGARSMALNKEGSKESGFFLFVCFCLLPVKTIFGEFVRN